jgi:hypothetical protein
MPKPIESGAGAFRPAEGGRCQKERPSPPGEISVRSCRCGVYHVRIDATMIDLTLSQFLTVARLFKMTLGALAGKGPVDPLREPSCLDHRG